MLGANGVEREKPPIAYKSVDAMRLWKSFNFRHELVCVLMVPPEAGFEEAVQTTFRVWAITSNATSDGGDGGIGGFGGKPGIFHAVGLEQPPKFTLFRQPGE